MDSGVLLNQGFFDYLKDPRLKVIPSGETPELARTKNMASWCFNHLLTRASFTGELIMYLNDDDLLYPEAFETYWNFYQQHDRAPQAMYASQDIGLVDPEGKTQIIGRRIADRPGGRFCKGRRFDCRVDNLQFCHTAKILEKFREVYKTSQYHSEDKRDAHHADGIFMEQIGALTKFYNIDKVLSMNRRTVESVNLESASPLGRSVPLPRKLRGRPANVSPRRRPGEVAPEPVAGRLRAQGAGAPLPSIIMTCPVSAVCRDDLIPIIALRNFLQANPLFSAAATPQPERHQPIDQHRDAAGHEHHPELEHHRGMAELLSQSQASVAATIPARIASGTSTSSVLTTPSGPDATTCAASYTSTAPGSEALRVLAVPRPACPEAACVSQNANPREVQAQAEDADFHRGLDVVKAKKARARMLFIENISRPGARQASAMATRCVASASNLPRSNISRTIGSARAREMAAAMRFAKARCPNPCRRVARNSGNFFSAAIPASVGSR